MSIGDATRSELGSIAAALRSSNRRGRIVIDDLENIAAAVTGGVQVRTVYTTEELTESDALGLPVRRLARRTAADLFGLERLSRTFALATAPEPIHLVDLEHDAADLVVLDGVRLAGNIGAVIRTTTAMGGSGVVLLDSGLLSVFDRRLIRASRGHVFTLPVVRAGRSEFEQFLSRTGLSLFTADADGEATIDEYANVTERTAIAFGSERRGCSLALKQKAVAGVRIATASAVDSLNVSVAAGIALHARHRRNLPALVPDDAAHHH